MQAAALRSAGHTGRDQVGRKLRSSDSAGDIAVLLDQALKKLDARGMHVTAAHVEMARITLAEETAALDCLKIPAVGSATASASPER